MNAILETLRRRWYLVATFLVVALAIVFRMAMSRPAPLTFVSPSLQDIESVVEVSGNVSAQRRAELKFLGGGKLTYLGVAEGDEVKKNQRIASIDTGDLRKSLAEALNTASVGRNNLLQGAADAGDQSNSATAMRKLASLQNTLNNNILDVEIKNLAIENSSLYSPFAGVVTKVPTNVSGMQVLVTDEFEVVDPASLVFAGEVDEVDIGKIKAGQIVHITFDAYPDETVNAVVTNIAMRATPSTKASGGTVFLVKAALPAQLFHYRLGMNGTLKIVTNSAKQALTIPTSALTERDSKWYVKVRTGSNVAAERVVQIGIQTDTLTQITSGLAMNDQVVEIK